MKKIIRKTVGAADRIGPILGAILALIGLIMASSAITPDIGTTQAARNDWRALAVPAVKLSGVRGAATFDLATSRVASVGQSDMPNDATLATDRQDYAPFSYVHITGAGFQPGETVNLIVVELEPEPGAFEPWDVVADENGNFDTSWYIFSEDFAGAMLQVSATGQSSGITASATFSDAVTAPASVGTAISNTAGTTLPITVTAAVPVGNTVIVAVATRETAPTVTVADSKLNLYTQDIDVANSTTVRTLIFSAPVTTALTTSDTITVSFSGSGATTKAASALSVMGLVSVSPKDRTAVGTGSGSSASTANTATTIQADELLIGAVGVDKAGSLGSAGTNYALVGGVAGSGSVSISLSPEYRIVSSTGAYSASWSSLGNNNWAAVLATYKTCADFTVSGGQVDPTCSSDTGTVTATFLGGAAPYMCKLDTGSFAPCTSPQSYSVPSGTAHVITVKDSNGCIKDTGTISVATGDVTNPTIGAAGANQTIECPATPSFTAPTASDNSGFVTVQQVSDTTAAGMCSNNYSRTVSWKAIDACGNTSATRSQTITVRDTTAPTISTLPGPSSIECTATPSFITPTATDACDPSPTLTFADVTTPGSCAQAHSVTRTWTATDHCGNSSTASQTINVVDTHAPSISGLPGPSSIECTATPVFTTPTATDACDPSPTLTFADVTTPGSCAQARSVTRTWTATDHCGNSSRASQTINVVDTQAPSLSALPGLSTIECTATPVFTTPTATDACDPSPTLTFADVTTPGSCAQAHSVTRTWTATDHCGNSSTASQTINVVDTHAPSIGALPGPSTIECTATPVFTTPTATDACDPSPTLTFVDVTTPGSCAQAHSVTRTWTATDHCGNSSTASQTINVVDTHAPSISALPGPSSIECTATPVFTTPTATDACDPSPTLTFADVTTPGSCAQARSVTRTWTATDHCGNSSTATQTINVVDTQAPSISALPGPSSIECTATPVFTTPTATDACDPSPTLTFADVTTPGSCAQAHSVTRTWTATDHCGNSRTASQTINVVDTHAPSIGALPGPSTIECTATPSFTTPTATDACDPSPTLTFADVTTPGSCAQARSVTRTWTATDHCGNSSTASQTINVVDTHAPSIGALPGPSTIECTATPVFTTPTATDACDPSPTLTFADVITPGSCAQAHIVTRTWTATDHCGNSSTASQTINVVDTTGPIIGGQGADYVLACGSSPSFMPPTASDACGGSTVSEISDTTVAGAHNSVIRTKTWRATDACGNTSNTVSQSVTIRASITVTANDRVKTFGTVLNLGTTEFMVSGNLGAGESITNVTLTSVTGKAGAINAPVGVYPNEIEPSNATGSGGFVASNYCIDYVKGQLTIVPPVFSTVPSNLTNGSLMCFDTDTSLPGRQFNLIYIQGATGYVLNASNPGQFYDNVLYVDPDPAHVGNMVTLKIYVPYPFVTQGAQPIRVYDYIAVSGNFPCINFTPGTDVSSSFTITTQGGTPSPSGAQTILLGDYGTSPVTGLTETFVTVTGPLPAHGLIYVNIHLDYGLKRTSNWTRTGTNIVDATNAAPTPYPAPTPSSSLLVRGASTPSYPSGQPYHLHAEGNGVPLCTPNSVCEDIAYSVNVFKKSVGVAGTVSDLLANPIPNATVKLYGPNSTTALVASALTDSDGTYFLNYKHTGREATFYVKLSCTSGDLVQTVSLKANDFKIVNFANVTCSQMVGPGHNPALEPKPKTRPPLRYDNYR